MQIIGTRPSVHPVRWRLVPKPCVFCGATATLTNAQVLSQPIRAAFSDRFVCLPPVQAGRRLPRRAFALRWLGGRQVQSGMQRVQRRLDAPDRGVGKRHPAQAHPWPADAAFDPGPAGSRHLVGPDRPLAPAHAQPRGPARHTGQRLRRLLRRQVAHHVDEGVHRLSRASWPGLPGRGVNGVPRSMADIARLLESDDLPAPVDMRAYTATLRLGFWVSHVLRVGSPQFIERVSPAGPALSPCLLTIWPAQDALTWPPRSLATIGGLMGLARSIDNTGIAVA